MATGHPEGALGGRGGVVLSRVVVGFDTSPAGLHALWQAVEQARTRRARLLVVHTRPGRRPLPHGPVVVDPAPPAPDAAIRVETTDALYLAEAGNIPGDVDIQLAVIEGDPASRLLSLADRYDDLLVMAAATTMQERFRRRPSVRRLLRNWRRHGSPGELLVATGPHACQRWEEPVFH